MSGISLPLFGDTNDAIPYLWQTPPLMAGMKRKVIQVGTKKRIKFNKLIHFCQGKNSNLLKKVKIIRSLTHPYLHMLIADVHPLSKLNKRVHFNG
ncbi:hypothetical protein DRP98_00945 [candidate division KSB1 bacterium]|nr:MAG: hypothetical protein DRP98_00945 [candidate division KSB1 bacterium]